MGWPRKPQPELHGRARRDLCEQIRRMYPNCWLCGEPIDLTLNRQTDPRGSTVDEIIPRSKAVDAHRAAHTLSNTRHAHRKCNTDRGNDLVTEQNTSRDWYA